MPSAELQKMPGQLSYLEKVRKLGAYCLSGDDPSFEERYPRARIYRHNVERLFSRSLHAAYPITMQWLKREEKESLLKAFLKTSPLSTAEQWKMPSLFFHWVDRGKAPFCPAPLRDLLLFEWLEIEVQMMDLTLPLLRETPSSDLLLLNPTARLVTLDFPVFRETPSLAAQKPGDYFLAAYRDLQTYVVHYMALSSLAACLFDELLSGPMGRKELSLRFEGAVKVERINKILECLFQAGIIFEGGFLPARPPREERENQEVEGR